MIGYSHLTAENDVVAEDNAACQATLSNDHAIAADRNVMTDLYEIIEFRSAADDRVSAAAAIDRRSSANLNIIFDYHPAELWHFKVATGTGMKAKAVLSKSAAGVHDHFVAD